MFKDNYGFIVAGYDGRVVNEREVRAASGVMFILGMLSAFNALALSHVIMAQIYLSAFIFDFLLRFVLPDYSPSLLLGRFIVRNQKPEYVGAVQKKFAWMLGLMLALPVFNAIVINDFDYTHMIGWACVLCLFLLFNEAAFGICYGCMLYRLFTKKESKHCPGGACEIRFVEESQRFSKFQAAIAISAAASIIVGFWFYSAKLENKTYFGEHIQELLMTDKQLQDKRDAEFEKESEGFMDDDWGE